MATATLLPDGTPSVVGWQVSGAANIAAATSDASDATYATDNIAGTTAGGHAVTFAFATTTLPSGAVIKKVTPKFRASQATGSEQVGLEIRVRNPVNSSQYLYYQIGNRVRPTASILDYSFPAGGAYLASPDPTSHPEWTPQFIVDSMQVLMSTTAVDTPPTGTGDHRVYKVWVEVEYDEQPVATTLALSPAGANTVTTRPGFTWLCDDPEGSAQAGRRVVLWTTTDFGDLNCPDANGTSFIAASDGTTRTAVAFTGVAGDPTEYSSDTTWSCPVDLAPTGVYTLCVLTADQVGDQVRFANAAGLGTLGFTMAITPPPTPVLSGVAWETANYRTVLTVTAKNNLLDADTADNEFGLAASWVANFNAAGGVSQVSTPTPPNGTFARRWISGGVGALDSSVITGAFYPCLPSTAYSFDYRGRSSAAARNHQLTVSWYTAAQVFISSLSGSSTAVNNSAWTQVKAENLTSPATARYFKVIPNALATGATESNYCDQASAYPGTTVPAWTRGGLVPAQRIVIERSTDGGTTWYPLPQCSTLDGGILVDGTTNQIVTTYDLATRHNVAARYRAKTTHFDGTNNYSSAYTSTAGPVTPVFDQFVLRSPLTESLALVFPLAGPIRTGRTERVGTFELIGVKNPVFVANSTGSGRMAVQAKITGEAAWTVLLNLQEAKATMVLQTDMDGVAWWVRFGAELSEELPVSRDRKSATTRPRFVDCELRMSNGPQGQGIWVP